MEMTGTGTPSAMGPTEDQNGADVTVSSGSPADGQDLAAAAGAGDAARAEGAQEARGRAIQERGRTQRAALLEQAEEAAARLTQLMTKLAGTGESPLTGRTNREDRLMAATIILQRAEAAD
jgi:hypothetical protein